MPIMPDVANTVINYWADYVSKWNTNKMVFEEPMDGQVLHLWFQSFGLKNLCQICN